MRMTTEAPSRLSRRRDRRKAEIVRETIRLLAINGYHAVSLEQVAEATDIAKPTLYHYFSSKDELVAEALDALTSGVMDRLEAIHTATLGESYRDQLRALSTEHLDILLGEYPEVGLIFSFQGSWPEVHDQARKSMRRRHDEIFRNVIREGMANGEFLCEDLEVALQCHHAIMNNVSSWFRQQTDPVATVAARTATINAVMRVVAAAGTD